MILEGTLVTAPGSPCLLIKPVGQPAVGLVWPQGYTASGSPVHVYTPDGVEVAVEGDLVTLAGGAINEPSPACRTQTSFEVSQVTRGAGDYAPYQLDPAGARSRVASRSPTS
jgi:hypothetical protein